MFRLHLVCVGISSLICVPHAYASSFGFSMNINFGAEALREGAGVFDDRIWNNIQTATQERPIPIFSDQQGRPGQSPATARWEGAGIGRAANVQSNDPEDAQMMSGFLDSPSTIILENLDQVVANRRLPLNYSLILYTYGGREGTRGRYTVNGRAQDHIDVGRFDGDFRAGPAGNVLIFSNLTDPTLTIETEGFGPINAMSLVYCRPGDVDGNGTIDVDDLEILNEAVRVGDGNLIYDINLDLLVDFQDVMSWIKCSKGTCVGDVNLDGVFDSGDLVQLFQVGVYESGDTAKWTTGDWNGDFKFDSSDLLLAFQEGCYETGDAFAVDAACLAELSERRLATLPEPSSASLSIGGSLLWLLVRRRARKYDR
jgi:hypothetical protein